jgi:uncharacterized spore protein YtfJ
MDIEELLAKAIGGIHVERVYGTPVERDGTLVIPAAAVEGAAGGGGGGADSGIGGATGEGYGSGGGFALRARPVGAFVIRGDDVRFVPAVDLVRLARAGAIVAVAVMFARVSIAWAGALRRARHRS